MSVVPTQGQPWTFLAEFFQYAGGPPTDVTNLQFEVFDITTSTTVLGPTNIGISHIDTGVYAWTWNPIPANQPPDQYVIIWTATETTASEPFVISPSSNGMSNGPCAGWSNPIWTCALDQLNPAVTGVAVQAAADVLFALTGRHLGVCQLTIRPCRKSCAGMGWPFLNDWWQWGIYPRPVFYNGVWYNITCSNCGWEDGCSCSVVSEAVMPAPVTQVIQVKVDGAVLPSSAYRMDNGRLLVRTDGGQWPWCNDLTKDDSEVGTWSVTVQEGVAVSTLGQMALGELATQFAKLITCDNSCNLPKAVQQVVRQGVTMNFLDPNEVFANGRVGLYLCDLFITTENPNGLMMASTVYDLDGGNYRITNT